VGEVHVPIGLSLIFLFLFTVGCINLFTKKVATISGLAFAAGFFALFAIAERVNRGKVSRKGHDEHLEKLNLRNEEALDRVLAEIDKPRRVLAAVRDPYGLQHLNRALDSLDPETTDMVVLYCKMQTGLTFGGDIHSLGPEEELLFTRIISAAEKHGKSVIPLIVVSNDPFYAIAQSALALGAGEVVLGVSGHICTDDQLERLAMTWGALQGRDTKPVTIRIFGGGREHIVEI
jgi:hypothetical protein